MMRVITAWGFGSVFFTTLGGPIYTAFVRSLSTDDRLYGLLAAALPMMSFLQVVAARKIERTGKRKRPMVVNGLISRSLWIVAALLPLLWVWAPQTFSKSAIFWMVLCAIAGSSVFQALAGTAFFSWMGDLVPERVRPTFFARRMQVGYATAIAVSLGAGIIADRWNTLPVLCVILALAACAGVVDIAMFFGVREPPASPEFQPSQESFWASLLPPLRDAATRQFLIFSSLLAVGYGFNGPFVTLHAMENLQLSKTVTGLVIVIAPLLGMVWSLNFWKNAIRAHGTRPVMRLCSMGLLVAPVGWLLAQPHQWLIIAAISFTSGVMAGGIELCNQTLLTGLSPWVPRPTLIALFSIASGISFALASICGGLLAQFLRGTNPSLFGFALLPYHVLFLLSLLIRIVNSFVVAPRLQEPDASSTLDTVREIIPELAQNFASLITRPLSKKEEI